MQEYIRVACVLVCMSVEMIPGFCAFCACTSTHAGATVVVVGVDKDFATLSVKDNGRGVPPRGRELLGSAHCTSKITAAEVMCWACAGAGHGLHGP